MKLIQDFGDKTHKVYKNFNTKQFIGSVLAHPWDELQLKELQLKGRIHRIAEKLGEYLPAPFEDALQILFFINESCIWFPYLFFPDFVATYGQQGELNYSRNAPAHIRLEYGIDFIKSNGSLSRKLFLLSDKTISGYAHLSKTRSHSFADLITRNHYPGIHRIVLLVNGKEAAQTMLNITRR